MFVCASFASFAFAFFFCKTTMVTSKVEVGLISTGDRLNNLMFNSNYPII